MLDTLERQLWLVTLVTFPHHHLIMGRLNLWGGGQVVPIMYVDAHGRVKWFLGGSLWCGVLGTPELILPDGEIGP